MSLDIKKTFMALEEKKLIQKKLKFFSWEQVKEMKNGNQKT